MYFVQSILWWSLVWCASLAKLLNITPASVECCSWDLSCHQYSYNKQKKKNAFSAMIAWQRVCSVFYSGFIE
jgi:hypothetical protein